MSAASAAVERHEVQAPGQARPTADPNLLEKGQRWLRSFVAYTCKVFGLRKGLEAVQDTRQEPTISTPVVAAALFFCGLLRIRSLNALEPKLREKPFVRLVGGAGKEGGLGSADTLSRSLRQTKIATVRALSVGIVAKAERNKVFREGWIGAMHAVAIDGWEVNPLQAGVMRRAGFQACWGHGEERKFGSAIVEAEAPAARRVSQGGPEPS